MANNVNIRLEWFMAINSALHLQWLASLGLLLFAPQTY